MATQRKINHDVDYLYQLNVHETEHQNHRLMWILTAQALLFAGLCTLASVCEEYIDACLLLVLLVVMAVLLSISSIYSVIISEVAIGSIHERWSDYDHQSNSAKNRTMPHLISLAPSNIMRSKFKFLQLYKFAPNVLCAGWISLVVALFYDFKDNIPLFIAIFCGILFFICVLASWINRYLFLEWDHNNKIEQREFAERHNNCCCANGWYWRGQMSTFSMCPPCHNCPPCSSCPPCPPNGGYPFKPSCPTDSGLRIYHIMVDRFRCAKPAPTDSKENFWGGNLRGIIEKLDFIKSLGYNAIMMTPIFETEAYHGYHIVSFENIDPSYGTWQDLKDLVAAVHSKGMKLICDFVPNHCSYHNSLFQQALTDSNSKYRSWFYFDESRKGGFVSFQNYPGLPKFNLYNKDAACYMINIAAKLVAEGVDGLRIDHAIGVPFEFLCKLKREMKALNPNVIIIGEAWAMNPRDISQIEFISHCRKEELMNGCASDLQIQDDIQCDYIGYLDGVLDFTYMNIIIDEVKHGRRINRDNCKLMYRLREHFSRYPKKFRLILFLDNHDTNRFMFYCHNDKSIFDEAIEFTKSLPYDSSYYYATELYAVNETDVFSGEPNADEQVRQAYQWDDDKDSE